MEHHESYLIAALGFVGLRDVTIVRAEGVALSASARAQALAKARAEIGALAA
jgi:FMN-dependent NADH-azoreductase